MNRTLYLLKNTRDVLLTERAAKQLSVLCRIIPVPRSISSECTMAIECTGECYDAIEVLLEERGIVHERVVISDNEQM